MFGLSPYNRRNREMMNRPSDFFNFDNFSNFIDSFFNTDFFPQVQNVGQMKVDIKEKDNKYILEAELPGVNKDEITLELRNDMLTISVEKNEQIEETKENYIRKERRYGSQSRSFYVENVKAEDIKANFENGILSISLPKKEVKPNSNRKIDIN
ncbi:Hsp20/alpha crystallin family protein [Proteiniborus sp. MB09-C3]|uniref:Hsp20/alpha crystallin family protein n=1 Tax=Proteiniborus sp. MB09-C3 TaxID=3050072 RepID=UPI002555381F|nr:Hsp20/alpha crystallin family protein [Proteiniborus sp. MB09-C3]WIV13422.1 Hsp20/alpha crystallin family protein [Proteiniborus sp. MB09-C3]